MSLVVDNVNVIEEGEKVREIQIKARHGGFLAWLLSLLGIGASVNVLFDQKAMTLEGGHVIGGGTHVQPYKTTSSYAVGLTKAGWTPVIIALVLAFLCMNLLAALFKSLNNQFSWNLGSALSRPISQIFSGGQGIFWGLLGATAWVATWMFFYKFFAKKGFFVKLVGYSGQSSSLFLVEGLDSNSVLTEALAKKLKSLLDEKITA
jgi:hypothetical protein